MKRYNKLAYYGSTIKCPLCGRKHGLEVGENYLRYDDNQDEIWLRCPTCGLKFEGFAVGKWNSAKAFEELGKAAQNFNSTMNKPSSATKTIYTIFLLDEVNHTVTKFFRTTVTVNVLGEILDHLSKTCRSGESYLAIEEVE